MATNCFQTDYLIICQFAAALIINAIVFKREALLVHILKLLLSLKFEMESHIEDLFSVVPVDAVVVLTERTSKH